MTSLDALKTQKIGHRYVVPPQVDRTTPYDVTRKAVHDLYKEGYFTSFTINNCHGLGSCSNLRDCRANGYIMPRVYQLII